MYRVSANRVVRVGEELKKSIEEKQNSAEKENCTPFSGQLLKEKVDQGQKCAEQENCTPSSGHFLNDSMEDEWDSVLVEREKREIDEKSRKRQAMI